MTLYQMSEIINNRLFYLGKELSFKWNSGKLHLRLDEWHNHIHRTNDERLYVIGKAVKILLYSFCDRNLQIST